MSAPSKKDEGVWLTKQLAAQTTEGSRFADAAVEAASHNARVLAMRQGYLPEGTYLANFQPLAGQRAGVDTTATGWSLTYPLNFWSLLLSKALPPGVTTLPLWSTNGRIIKQTATASAEWDAENPGSNAADSNFTTAAVASTSHMLVTTTSVSRQALFSAASGNLNLERTIRDDLAASLGAAIRIAAINGTGTNQPVGLLGNSAVPTYALGTDGAAMTQTDVCKMREAVEAANAGGDFMAWYGGPALARKLRSTQRFTGGGIGILHKNKAADAPFYDSTAVPATLTKGSSTGVCSAAILGNWEDFAIAQWAPGVEFVVDELTLKRQAMVEITARIWIDTFPLRPTSFIKVVDALTV